MAPFTNDPSDDDLYNSKWDVRTIRKRKQLWMVAMEGIAGANILPDQEVFIYQARALFNTPYHTCGPVICRTIEKLALAHCNQCSDVRCYCGLSAYYVERPRDVTSVPKHERRSKKHGSSQAPKRAGKGKPRAKSTSKPPEGKQHTQAACEAFPDSNNVKHAKNIYVKTVTEPEGAGEGLFSDTP